MCLLPTTDYSATPHCFFNTHPVSSNILVFSYMFDNHMKHQINKSIDGTKSKVRNELVIMA